MISIQVQGLEDIQLELNELLLKVSSEEFWVEELGILLEEGKDYAISISPVVTGSYQASHRWGVVGMVGTLSMDPLARNVVTGTLVSDYAGMVEKKHKVYERTGVFMQGLVEQRIGVIGEALLHGD